MWKVSYEYYYYAPGSWSILIGMSACPLAYINMNSGVPPTIAQLLVLTRVSAATDKPAWCSRSAHDKYSVSHHMVIKPFILLGLARCVINSCQTTIRSLWHSPATKLISRSRDMVGAHQNLNGSRDLTTPLSGMFCHPWASTCYRQPT